MSSATALTEALRTMSETVLDGVIRTSLKGLMVFYVVMLLITGARVIRAALGGKK